PGAIHANGFPNLPQMVWLARSRSLGPGGPLAPPRSLSPPPRRLKSHCAEMRCRAKRADFRLKQLFHMNGEQYEEKSNVQSPKSKVNPAQSSFVKPVPRVGQSRSVGRKNFSSTMTMRWPKCKLTGGEGVASFSTPL